MRGDHDRMVQRFFQLQQLVVCCETFIRRQILCDDDVSYVSRVIGAHEVEDDFVSARA